MRENGQMRMKGTNVNCSECVCVCGSIKYRTKRIIIIKKTKRFYYYYLIKFKLSLCVLGVQSNAHLNFILNLDKKWKQTTKSEPSFPSKYVKWNRKIVWSIWLTTDKYRFKSKLKKLIWIVYKQLTNKKVLKMQLY